MGGEAEAAGDVLTGAIVATTIDKATRGVGSKTAEHPSSNCLNCGAALDGAYCIACGQPAHIHRSLLALGHEILHGVFHFEGKIWRTLPELFFHPGRLTRRYIDGERAKFVSPMALFLFTVFLMFAVFSFTGGALIGDSGDSAEDGEDDAADSAITWRSGIKEELETMDEKIADLREELAEPDTTAARRSAIDTELRTLERDRTALAAVSTGDWAKLRELDEQEPDPAPSTDTNEPPPIDSGLKSGFDALQTNLGEAVKKVNENPSLLIYKLKTNGYKFSWALIPLSLPFLWLLFFWRRDVHVYDHAIFVTYSISFMMMLLILLSLAAAVGVSGAIWGLALVFVPPIHMYKHLRGTYRLSRFGAVVRLFVLMIAISIVLTLFTALLVIMGLLG